MCVTALISYVLEEIEPYRMYSDNGTNYNYHLDKFLLKYSPCLSNVNLLEAENLISKYICKDRIGKYQNSGYLIEKRLKKENYYESFGYELYSLLFNSMSSTEQTFLTILTISST